MKPDTIIIMLTGENNIKIGIQAMTFGAFDYILKPFDYTYLEQRLKLAVDKYHSEQLKKMYIAGMVHDLKNPLCTAKFCLDTIGMINNSEVKNKKINNLKIAAGKSFTQMEKMIGNILNLDKMTSGKYINKNEHFNLHETVVDSIAYLNDLEMGSKINVEYNFPVEMNVYCDKELYLHILYNLISNAKRYSNKDIEVKIKVENGYLITSVKNEGSYIPPEKRKMIFDIFIQINDTCRINENNFGLGLSFCKAAVTCLGGEITVESEEATETTIFSYTVKVS